MVVFYGNEENREKYRKNMNNLQKGEICVAKVKKPSYIGVTSHPSMYCLERCHVLYIDKATERAEVELLDDYRTKNVKVKNLYYIRQQYLDVPAFVSC